MIYSVVSQLIVLCQRFLHVERVLQAWLLS